MSLADLIVYGVLLLCGLGGLSRGLFGFVLGLLTWAAAGIATFHGLPYLRPYARQWINEPGIADIAAGLVLFAVLAVVFRLVVQSALGDLRFGMFGLLNRVLGLLAGLAVGAMILCGGYVAGQRFLGLEDRSEFYRDSRMLPWLQRGATVLMPSIGFLDREPRDR